jgi:hypothetical protein
MAVPETQPTGEQIRFNSSVTGETVLDAYLEACERGGRTLPSLLADLFDSSGVFRSDLVQFRVNSATRNLQTRAGTFANPEAGWVNVPNGFVFRQRGAHANATAYEQLDVITHAGSTYFCTIAHTSNTASPNLANFALIIDGSALAGLNSVAAFSVAGRANAGGVGGIALTNNTILGRAAGDIAALDGTTVRSVIGLGNVENKTSATIRSELTSGNVTTALGFTPYNSTNPAGYITGITGPMVTTALGFTPLSAAPVTSVASKTGAVTLVVGDVSGAAPLSSPAFTGTPTAPTAANGTSTTQVATTQFVQSAISTISTGVISFNTRAGAITLTSGDVTTALGFTPYNSSNPNGYITGITSGNVTAALGFTPYNATNPAGYITGITGPMVTTALGFTPYSAANPAGYLTSITSGNVTTALGFTPYNSTNPAGYITGITGAMVNAALGYTASSFNPASAAQIVSPVNGTSIRLNPPTGGNIISFEVNNVQTGRIGTANVSDSGVATDLVVTSTGLLLLNGTQINLAAGANNVRIDASGRLGIGTTSPGSQLDISGTADQTFRARRTSGAQLSGTASSTTALFGTDSNHPLLFVTNGTERMRVNAAGGLSVTGTVTASGFTGPLTGNATNVTGTVGIGNGGTGATDQNGARNNLGLGSLATKNQTVSASAASGGGNNGDLWFRV